MVVCFRVRDRLSHKTKENIRCTFARTLVYTFILPRLHAHTPHTHRRATDALRKKRDGRAHGGWQLKGGGIDLAHGVFIVRCHGLFPCEREIMRARERERARAREREKEFIRSQCS